MSDTTGRARPADEAMRPRPTPMFAAARAAGSASMDSASIGSASMDSAAVDSSAIGATADLLTDAGDGLLSRVQLIDDAPLEERASAYLQVHEQLRTRLEG